ncbi:hypothetical protein GCM10027570_46060 [Streptomonospora sediminis]
MDLVLIGVAAYLLAFLFLFPPLAGFWILRLIRLLRLRRRGNRAEGTAVSVPKGGVPVNAAGTAVGEAPPTERSGGKQRLVVRFETGGGRTVDAKPGLALAFARARPGQRVTVVYDPARPPRADIVDWRARIRVHQLIIASVAVVCLVLGAAALGVF